MINRIATSVSAGTQIDRVREAHPGGMVIPSICDICKTHRGKGNHTNCSKIRQQRYFAQGGK